MAQEKERQKKVSSLKLTEIAGERERPKQLKSSTGPMFSGFLDYQHRAEGRSRTEGESVAATTKR